MTAEDPRLPGDRLSSLKWCRREERDINREKWENFWAGVCAPSSNAEEAEVEWFYEDLQDLWELTPKKDVLFIIGDWNAKVGSQETPGVTDKFGIGIQNEAGQRLIVFPRNALVITNTLLQQHKRRLYTWKSPDGQHWNLIDYILCSQRWRNSIQSTKNKTRSWLWLRPWTPRK